MAAIVSQSEFFEQSNWFCLHTRPKSEHLAAMTLYYHSEIEVYCPRIRFKRPTKRGQVRFTEALFPCYLFARFRPVESMRTAMHAKGVTKILSFGDRPAIIPPELIELIRQEMQGEDLMDVEAGPTVGDEVTIRQGAFAGISGIVTSVPEGSERVCILMEILGEMHEVEVKKSSLDTGRHPREQLRV